MTKSRLSQKMVHILFWSIISAAFIGPGTVTTAAKAGASYGFSLVWALLFSVIATIFLQEAAARLSLISQKNIGQILQEKYGQKSRGLGWMVFLSIAFGCAAYQTGNILGAVSGLAFFSETPKIIWILLIGFICLLILWNGNFRRIANILGFVVAVMGIVFIYVAFCADISVPQLLRESPKIIMPDGSYLLVIGLIGTTIVPYNLFLGSGISKGQLLGDMRFGLSIAVLIGGIISVAILIVGTQVQGVFSFESLAVALTNKTGTWIIPVFGIGLFSAGLSSSITAPFAAAVTAQSIFQKSSSGWQSNSLYFRIVWISVLLIGMIFSLADVKPIPAIIMAQAINGFLLPLVAIFLLIFVNDRSLLGKHINRLWHNLILFFIVGVCIFLGFFNVWSAIAKTNNWSPDMISSPTIAVASGVILLPVFIQIIKKRKQD